MDMFTALARNLFPSALAGGRKKKKEKNIIFLFRIFESRFF